MRQAHLHQTLQIGWATRERLVDVVKHARGTRSRGQRDHAAVLSPKAEPVRGASGDVHQRAGDGHRDDFVHTKLDLTIGHEEGFIPGVVVRRRAAAFRALLQKDLVATCFLSRGQHGDLFADDGE